MFKIGDRVRIGSGYVGIYGKEGVVVAVKSSGSYYTGIEGRSQFVSIQINGFSDIQTNFFESELELVKNGVEIMLELL